MADSRLSGAVDSVKRAGKSVTALINVRSIKNARNCLLAAGFHIKSVLVKTSRNPFWIFLAVFSIGILRGAYGAEPNALSLQARKDFEWFSNLSFPDTKGCPYVRVAAGEWNQGGDEPPRNTFIKAF